MTWEDIAANPDGPPVSVNVAAGMLGVSLGYLQDVMIEVERRESWLRGTINSPRVIRRRDLLWQRGRMGEGWDWHGPPRPA